MIDVFKQSALLLEQLIGLLLISEKIFELDKLEVVGFSVPPEVPGLAVSIIVSLVSSSFGDRDDASGF